MVKVLLNSRIIVLKLNLNLFKSRLFVTKHFMP